LGEIGSVAMCRRIFKYQTTESGDIPFFKIGSFGGTPDAFISKDLFESFKVKYPYPEKGDVLISASGSIGRTVVFTGKDEYFQDSNIVWLKHNNSIINSFLNYLYSTVKWAGIEGTTIKRLYNDNILKTEAIIPTLLEQQKISDYLDGINYLITLHQSKSFGYIFKAIVSFTLYWEQRKLGEMVEFYNGDRSSRYPNDSDMVFDGIPFINAGDLVLGRVKLDTTNKITEEKYNQLSGAKIQCGDIIYCLRGTLGKNAFVDNFDIGTIASSLVDIRPQKIVGKYLFQVLNSDIEYSQRILNDEGAAQPNLSAKNLYLFDIPIPRDAEQIKIAEYLELLDHLITLHQLEPFQLIFKAIAYRIIDYTKSKPPRCRKYTGLIAFIKYHV